MAAIRVGQTVTYYDRAGRDSPALVLAVHDQRQSGMEVLDLATFEGDVEAVPHREACIESVEEKISYGRREARAGEPETHTVRKRTPGLAYWHN